MLKKDIESGALAMGALRPLSQSAVHSDPRRK
jgi:hypothetical protein